MKWQWLKYFVTGLIIIASTSWSRRKDELVPVQPAALAITFRDEAKLTDSSSLTITDQDFLDAVRRYRATQATSTVTSPPVAKPVFDDQDEDTPTEEISPADDLIIPQDELTLMEAEFGAFGVNDARVMPTSDTMVPFTLETLENMPPIWPEEA